MSTLVGLCVLIIDKNRVHLLWIFSITGILLLLVIEIRSRKWSVKHPAESISTSYHYSFSKWSLHLQFQLHLRVSVAKITCWLITLFLRLPLTHPSRISSLPGASRSMSKQEVTRQSQSPPVQPGEHWVSLS